MAIADADKHRRVRYLLNGIEVEDVVQETFPTVPYGAPGLGTLQSIREKSWALGKRLHPLQTTQGS